MGLQCRHSFLEGRHENEDPSADIEDVWSFVEQVESSDTGALKIYPISEREFVRLPEGERIAIRNSIRETGDQLFDFARVVGELARVACDDGRAEEASRIVASLRKVARANLEEPTTVFATRYAAPLERLTQQEFCHEDE